MLKLTIGSYVSVRSLRYKARGKFGEHERGKCLPTSGACTIGIWSTLAQLNLIRQIYALCYNSYWPILKVGSIRMGWLRLSEQENFTRSLHIMSVPRTHKYLHEARLLSRLCVERYTTRSSTGSISRFERAWTSYTCFRDRGTSPADFAPVGPPVILDTTLKACDGGFSFSWSLIACKVLFAVG